MKYMMMFWVDESGETTADEDAAMMIAVKSWVDQMTERGVLVHGGALRSAGEAAIVHVRDGEVLISDGPFAETKEQIGGYAIIRAESKAAAIEHGKEFMKLHSDVIGPSYTGRLEIRAMAD